MISKFIFCLLAAGAFGFIVGWILSSLIKNEKAEEKYNLIKEDFDTKRAELNQVYSDLQTKEQELSRAHKHVQQLEKELLTKNMDLEEYQNKGFLSTTTPDSLTLENNALKEEISEYKYLENENDLLHNELKELGVEKEKLIQELERYRNNGKSKQKEPKSKLTSSLESQEISTLKSDLKKAKRRLQKMAQYLNKIEGKKAPKKQSKKSKKEQPKRDEPIFFDFDKEL